MQALRKYAIYSAEGFAREILPSLRSQAEGDKTDIVLVDDDPGKKGAIVHGCKVIDFAELCTDAHRDRQVSVAVADPAVRQNLVGQCEAEGFSFFSISDPSHVRLDNVAVGEGAISCAHTVYTGDAEIGRHFHANIYSYVAHDCRIGDFVTFAPRVSCNGRVHIGDGAFVGTGAVIRQGTAEEPLRIGRGAVVGMGSVVLHNVPDGAIVAGNPAKLLRTNREI